MQKKIISITTCVVIGMFTGITAKAETAQAAPLNFQSCKHKQGVECATLNVPLNWKDTSAQAAQLHVERIKKHATGKSSLIFLAGGPGQAATPLDSGPHSAYNLFPKLKDTLFVTFDQRGIGSSRSLVQCSLPTDSVKH